MGPNYFWGRNNLKFTFHSYSFKYLLSYKESSNKSLVTSLIEMRQYKVFRPIVLRTASGTNHPLQLDLFLSLLWQSLITQDQLCAGYWCCRRTRMTHIQINKTSLQSLRGRFKKSLPNAYVVRVLVCTGTKVNRKTSCPIINQIKAYIHFLFVIYFFHLWLLWS